MKRALFIIVTLCCDAESGFAQDRRLGGGIWVPNAPAVEKAFDKVLTMLKKKGDFRHGIGKYRDMAVHEICFNAVDPDEAKVVGKRPSLRYAFSKDLLHISYGPRHPSASLLKWVMDTSLKPMTQSRTPQPVQVHLHLRPLSELATQHSGASRDVRITLESLKHSDRLSIVTEAPRNGLRVRVEAQEGVLKMIAPFIERGVGRAPLSGAAYGR